MKLKMAVFAALLAAAPVAALAQDKMELTPGSVEQLDLAATLTNYGIERNDPLLLLAAARILKTLDPAAAESATAMSADDLIAKAREIAGGKNGVDAVAAAITGETSKGLCHGPGTVYGCF